MTDSLLSELEKLSEAAKEYVSRCPMCNSGVECQDDLCFDFRNALITHSHMQAAQPPAEAVEQATERLGKLESGMFIRLAEDCETYADGRCCHSCDVSWLARAAWLRTAQANIETLLSHVRDLQASLDQATSSTILRDQIDDLMLRLNRENVKVFELKRTVREGQRKADEIVEECAAIDCLSHEVLEHCLWTEEGEEFDLEAAANRIHGAYVAKLIALKGTLLAAPAALTNEQVRDWAKIIEANVGDSPCWTNFMVAANLIAKSLRVSAS